MAEYVERKFTAAKLSVALAIAAVLGGLAARDQSAGATEAVKGPSPHMAPGSITSSEIKNESLLFKDFKPNQVFSDNQVNAKFLKITDADVKYLKIDEASDIFLKLDQASDIFIKREDANKAFVKVEDAAHQFINGDGKVVTGFETSTGGAVAKVLEVPGFVRAEGVPPSQQAGPRARLTNLGGTPLHYGTGGGAGVIAPGATQEILISGGQAGGSVAVQLIDEASPPTVGTLTLTGILIGLSQGTNFSGQILIGAGL
jgi:hypothetical protein